MQDSLEAETPGGWKGKVKGPTALAIAVVLVSLVIFTFLGSLRATVIPAVPPPTTRML